MSDLLVADLALARRLEHAEGSANIAFVESRAARDSKSGAAWKDFEGTFAMFDGPGSPLTQTFGLGLFSAPTHDSLAAIEAFFTERGAPVFHETCPIADIALLSLLPDRGYRPVEQGTVLYQSLTDSSLPAARVDATLEARLIEPGDEERWANAGALGWGETPELADFVRSFGIVSAHSRGTYPFIVDVDGEAVATGALAMHGGVAVLAGASTRAEWRGRGAQAALLVARLHHALAAGCDVALMAAQPGSGSQRNAERQGFRIAYTRTKWQLHRGNRLA